MSAPFRQDMPPTGPSHRVSSTLLFLTFFLGGFEAIKYKRNLPTRGPGALAILGGVTAFVAYGFYRVGLGNTEKK